MLNLSTNRTDIRTVVVKVGTTLLGGERGFDGRLVEELVKDIAALKHERGLNILLVSSGAIGCGMDVLGLKERPRLLPLKQAVAAVGQSRLMHYYETLFQTYGQGLRAGQVLLSASDLENRQSYLNARNTIKTLFELGIVVPVINENDSTATEELRFGNNDVLAAKVAAKMDADLLIILSDVDGLYDKDPKDPTATLIPVITTITEEVEASAADTRAQTSVGGMKTKLTAARIACAAGLECVIANGHRAGVLRDVIDGKGPMTRFLPEAAALSHRKRWIAFGRTTRGALTVDDGARTAIVEKGRSLLAAGITAVDGSFPVGSSIRLQDRRNCDIAIGLVNYSSEEINLIKGCKSGEIEAILGHKDFDEVIHRDNLVLLKKKGADHEAGGLASQQH
jgi:glutamate 5-kinase